MKTLTVSACRRPLYTHLVLSALAQCRGVVDYDVLINIDASGTMLSELVKVCEPFIRHHSKWAIGTRSPAPVGCNAAIVSCMEWGFARGSNFHVHLEDDTLPHADFLSYMEWAGQEFWHREDVFSVCGHTMLDGDPKAAFTRRWFTPWGWGMWSDRWAAARERIDVPSGLSWDCQLHLIRGDRFEVVPALGLVQNIGQHDGTYNTSEIWSREQFVPAWAGSRRLAPPQCRWELQGEEPK
jgi:hypothetical protein